jgi:hypothetical protein
MAIAALVISIVAVVFTGLSLWYTHLANERAKRAESRDAARFAGEQAEAELEALDRVGAVMRELAAAVGETVNDPQALGRVHATKSRLEQEIAATGIPLPACASYAMSANHALRPAAERELGQVRAAIRRVRQH